jgi:adenylate cyclase
VVTDIGAPIFLYFFFFIITGGFLALTHWHVLSAMPSMAGTLAAVAATGFNRFIASKDREFMKQAFASYMEEDLLEQMVEGHRLPSLDGEDREVTAFFSDIRGFSTFSEQLKDQPKKLMALLNRYLSTVTPLIKAEGACIDKYIGDSVVALFGAPVSHEDHALRACRAALTVQTAVGELRKKLAAEGLPDVYTRIGLNTDHMLVGNIGSDELLDYTALGDGMNLASRLEGANKAFETLILIGPKTYAAVKEHVVARELDLVRVAGKHEPIAVYELNGLKGQVGAERLKVLELYGKALELYRFRRFSDALKVLKEAYDLDHADGPVRVLAAKCNRFMQHPPPNDWDTVSQLEK